MKKILLILVIALVFSLTSCVAPEIVNINEDISYTNLAIYDDDIYFRVFRLYVPNNESMLDYTYGFQVKTSKDLSIVLKSPDEEVIFSEDVTVFLYKDLSRTISTNSFVGKCIDNDTITVEITLSDGTMHSLSFEYLTSRTTYYVQESYPTFSVPQFDIWIIVTTISILLTLFIISISIYRVFYQRRINHSLNDAALNKKSIMDLSIYIKMSLLITIALMISLPFIEKSIFDHTVIQQVTYEKRSNGVLNMDLEDITMMKLKYERIQVSIDLDVLSCTIFERNLDLTYDNIEEYVLQILSAMNHQIVDYDTEFIFFPTSSETHYIIELETADTSSIIIKFILISDDEYRVEVEYIPDYPDFPNDGYISVIASVPIYSFEVSNTDSSVVALFELLNNATRITP
jgi:hypothetical protein